MFKIVTERLLLRDFLESDLTAFRSLRRDAKFLRFYDEEDSDDHRADHLLRMFIEQASERPRTRYQLAITTSTGELAGTVGIRKERFSDYSIGCELGRRWHGKGIARDAGRAMINYGFDELGANRIYAETVTENKAAIRLCRQLGMEIESERKADRFFKGRAWGTTVLSVFKSNRRS